jgi:hypothetical protein
MSNNSIYRIVGELLDENSQKIIQAASSQDALKINLKQQLAGSRFHKDIHALGGLDSPVMNQVLDAFIAALPKKHVMPEAVPVVGEAIPVVPARLVEPQYIYQVVDVHCNRCRHTSCRCSSSNDTFWLWMLLSNSGNRTEHHYYHDTNKKDDKKKENSAGDIFLAILALAAAIMLLLSAVIAAIYLFGEVADILERLFKNEGRAYAMLSLSLLGASAAGSFLASTLLMSLIFVAIGVSNPVGWSIFGVACLGMVLTSLTHALVFNIPFSVSKNNFQTTFGEDGFIAKDCGRVQLTESEKANLVDEGLDPVKVGLAISLLRHEMGGGVVPNKYGNHALFNQTCRTPEQKKHLETIRLLRAGDLEDQEFSNGKITIGNMRVDMCARHTIVEAEEQFEAEPVLSMVI